MPISTFGAAGGAYTYVQDAEPSGAEEGETWYDSGANEAYVYDGNNWVEQTVVDHAELSGLTASDHHRHPISTLSEVSHSLSTGEFVALARLTVPNDAIEIHSQSIVNDAFNTPAGLNLIVRNVTAGVNEYSNNANWDDDTVVSITGLAGDNVIICLDNGNFGGGSGNNQVVTGHADVWVA